MLIGGQKPERTTVIRNTYSVTEESGIWFVVIDGIIFRNVPYCTSKAAQLFVDKLSKTNDLWTGIFEIETRIAEALKDEPWPYGATCINYSNKNESSWLLTEPYRNDDDAVRIVKPDPTGYVQISVYNRELYEKSCIIAGIEPDTDESISEEFCDYGRGQYISEDDTPIDAVRKRLAYRRAIGIKIEESIDETERFERLENAGLMIDAFTREQYTEACSIMGSPELSDRQVRLVVALQNAQQIGIEIITPGIPYDKISIGLACRRAIGMNTNGDMA